jgi:hypothetical protein
MAREAGVGLHFCDAKEIELQSLEDLHVEAKGACCCCRLSQEGNRSLEQAAQKVLIDKLVEDRILEDCG